MYHLIKPLSLPKNCYYGFLASCGCNVKLRNLSSSDSLVSVTEDDKKKIAVVKMQRAPVNSLNLELVQQLTSAIKDLEKKRFKGIILSSNSPTVFSAGLDIMEMYNPTEDRLRSFWTSLQEMWKTLYFTPIVTMAAINGHAPAGGCMLSLSCDYSIMVKSKSLIGMNETLLGIVAPKWFRMLIINNMGFRKAEKSLNLGTLYTPEEALSLNIVDELVENQTELMSRVQTEIEKWVKIPGMARQATKLDLRKPFIDEFMSYKNQELEDIVKFVYQDQTQKTLGKYIENLKSRKG